MRHSGGFLLRIMPPSWHPVPACVRSGCCRRNHSPLPQGKLVLDAENRCRYDRSRRNLSSLPLRRLESDAERCGGRDRCRSGGFLLRIMPPSWHPVPACVRSGCCRRNYSSLPLRKLESDAERCCGRDRCRSGGFVLRIMPPSWHPVPACSQRLCCRRAIHRCSNDGAAVIPKFGHEIQNHCKLEDISGQNHAVIPKLTPSNQESMHARGLKQGKPCIDSQVWA